MDYDGAKYEGLEYTRMTTVMNGFKMMLFTTVQSPQLWTLSVNAVEIISNKVYRAFNKLKNWFKSTGILLKFKIYIKKQGPVVLPVIESNFESLHLSISSHTYNQRNYNYIQNIIRGPGVHTDRDD